MGKHETMTEPERWSIVEESPTSATVCTSLPDEDVVRQANKFLPTNPLNRWGIDGEAPLVPCGRWPESHRHVRVWR